MNTTVKIKITIKPIVTGMITAVKLRAGSRMSKRLLTLTTGQMKILVVETKKTWRGQSLGLN